MVGAGRVAADIDVEVALSQVKGQERAAALAYLSQTLPLRRQPEVTIWPDWFSRIPYLPIRIQAEIDTGI
jgi:hypothetical protein